MRKFGYLDSSSTTTSETLYHEEAVTSAVKKMQMYGALNETGVLDNATLKVSLTKWWTKLVYSTFEKVFAFVHLITFIKHIHKYAFSSC